MPTGENVTPQQIWDAADKLKADGVPVSKISNRKIIEITGGKNATVTDVLAEWKAEQEHNQSLKSVDLPLKLTEKLNLFGAEVWRDAMNDAGLENVALREQVVRLKDEMKDLAEEFRKDVAFIEEKNAESIAALEAENADIKAKAAEARDLLTVQRDAEEARANDLDESLKKAREEIAALQAQVTSEANLKAMLTALVGQMKEGDK